MFREGVGMEGGIRGLGRELGWVGRIWGLGLVVVVC